MRGGVNDRWVRQFQKDMQKKLDKHPVYVPVVADYSAGAVGQIAPPVVNHHYNGPVFYASADGAQLAWNVTGDVSQQQQVPQDVSPGFERLAHALTEILRGLPSAALDDETEADARDSAQDALAEMTQGEPNRSVIRRCVSAVKGFLLPVASGVASGAADGAQEWTRQAIASLELPF